MAAPLETTKAAPASAAPHSDNAASHSDTCKIIRFPAPFKSSRPDPLAPRLRPVRRVRVSKELGAFLASMKEGRQ